MRLQCVHVREPGEIEAPRLQRQRQRPQRPSLRGRETAGGELLVGAGEEGVRGQRVDGPGKPPMDRVGAGDRHLLRDDDPGETRKARLATAQRRWPTNLEQVGDHVRVPHLQDGQRRREGRFRHDRRAGMVAPGWDR